MKQFTRTNVNPGNCWQTAIACILEVEPDSMPPQCEIEAWPNKVLDGWGSYINALNGYLAKGPQPRSLICLSSLAGESHEGQPAPRDAYIVHAGAVGPMACAAQWPGPKRSAVSLSECWHRGFPSIAG